MEMKRASIQVKALLLAVLCTLSFPFSAFAEEGGTSGGGMGKNANWMANENLRAILDNDQLRRTLGPDGIDEIKLLSIDKDGFHYRITANSIMTEEACVINATVWNSNEATVDQVKVTKFKVVSGCKPPIEKPSVFKVYKKEMDLFSKEPFNGDDLYSKSLDIARTISPEKRAEIREFMRTSSESKYYETYKKEAKRMANTIKKHPNMTQDQALYMLYIVMGFDPNSGGIVIPALVGLDIAPLFIVDADSL